MGDRLSISEGMGRRQAAEKRKQKGRLMARTERDRDHLRSLVAGMIPAHIAKRIDHDELTDRLGVAARLMKQAGEATSPVIARGFGDQARAILEAQPRERTLRQVREHLSMAEMATTVGERDRHRAAAEQIRATHPVVPERRAAVLRKAREQGLVPVYDVTGRLVGVCDPAKITPVEQTPTTKTSATKRRPR